MGKIIVMLSTFKNGKSELDSTEFRDLALHIEKEA